MIGSVTAPDCQPAIDPAIDAVWRMESARIVAALVRIVRDIGLAEDVAHDALVAALEQWPAEGIPRNPGAWLMTAARRRAIDVLRHRAMADRKHEQIAYETDDAQPPACRTAALDEDIGDDLLRLVFIACHPVLSREGRAALTLKLLCGLSTQEIARAFLVPEPTMAQRIVRAKRALTAAAVPFEVPRGADRNARLASVLEVIYLVFNEGYAAAAGDDWIRPALCDEALRLGRVLAELMPGESEVHGLVALMELQASRLKARVDAAGAPVRLEEQNRARWDRVLIRRGLAAIARARALGGDRAAYLLQAEIAACHARALDVQSTDWRRIAALYEALALVLAVAGRHPEPRRGRRDGRGAGRRPGDRRCAAATSRRCATTTCCRRCVPTCCCGWTVGGGARRVRACRLDDRQRARARAAARSRPGGWGLKMQT